MKPIFVFGGVHQSWIIALREGVDTMKHLDDWSCGCFTMWFFHVFSYYHFPWMMTFLGWGKHMTAPTLGPPFQSQPQGLLLMGNCSVQSPIPTEKFGYTPRNVDVEPHLKCFKVNIRQPDNCSKMTKNNSCPSENDSSNWKWVSPRKRCLPISKDPATERSKARSRTFAARRPTKHTLGIEKGTGVEAFFDAWYSIYVCIHCSSFDAFFLYFTYSIVVSWAFYFLHI